MPRDIAQPLNTVRLTFRPGSRTAEDLSVVERVGPSLFVAADEGAEVVRLTTADGGNSYAEDAAFPLSEFFALPAADGDSDEADIEGMAVDGGWLWLVGSHSLARSKPKRHEDEAAALARLTAVRRDPNRFLLGRIPLRTEVEGLAVPVREDGGRSARSLAFKNGGKNGGNALTKALKHDEHLGRFLGIPAKENGFDVEGLAARGDRLFLGLRGPVLRGWACILELVVKEHPHHPGRLKLRRIGQAGERYRKHFLDLDGLGIRELTLDGEDLVILAGPTMDLDGPVALWRWTGALGSAQQRVIPRDQLVHLLDLPHGEGTDHAEGICRIPRAGAAPALLVVYDSPGQPRRHGDGVDADLFALPSRYDPANAFLA
ncbi:DUF3616 domain-containing protein [Azospirillum sp. sgz302134]